jgi:hypothetical protein
VPCKLLFGGPALAVECLAKRLMHLERNAEVDQGAFSNENTRSRVGIFIAEKGRIDPETQHCSQRRYVGRHCSQDHPL